MPERRSLRDAITMTPEKLAFIQGQTTKKATPPSAAAAEKPAGDTTIGVGPSAPEATRESRPRTPRRVNRGRPAADQLESMIFSIGSWCP